MASSDTGISAFQSLGADINKRKGEVTPENKEGVVSEKFPELTLAMPDDDIIKLTDKWEKDWRESVKKQEWEKSIEDNEKYWLGKQYDGPMDDKSRPMVDNLIFEVVETFLPLATRRNPEPLVAVDNSEKDGSGNENPVHTTYINKVKGRLADLGEKNKLRLKLKKGARHWAVYQLGVAKIGWDMDKDIPSARIIRPQRMILDPDAITDEDGYSGNRVGEYRKMTASKILSIIGEVPHELDETSGEVKSMGNGEAVAKVKSMVKENLDTEIQFVEWWTPEYTCWKLDKTILRKQKNPHWNYDQEQPVPAQTQVDEFGAETVTPETTESIPGINHLSRPDMPYIFLTVFNLGDQPMDKTSLITQNLSNQDLINKRNKQIDKNIDRMNGGMVVSLERSGLTQSQAKGVSDSLRRGGVVVIPSGSPREAIDTYQPPSLPPDVFGQLTDVRDRLRDIFGVKGSSQAGLASEDTVRGKILSTGLDTDRIGGGITEYLELFASNIYNWFVQMLYVYDDGFQFVAGARPPKILVSVKDGSLLPKDSSSIANQALELAKMNKISNIDLYKRLEYPNPEELAANVWLETNAPHLLYKDNQLVQQAFMQMQQMSAANAESEGQGKEDEHTRNLQKGEIDHQNKMEQEQVKLAAKQTPGQPGGSILSRVPVPR